MPAGRFLVEGVALSPGARIELPAEVAHQARDVLRLSAGDTLRLLDGVGGEFAAEIVDADRQHVAVRLGERVTGRAEPAVRVALCAGMLKAAKFEWVLQKGTELGVAEFIPLLTERAVGAADEASDAKRRRWTKIVAEALEQCGGTRLPAIAEPRPLMHALASLPSHAVALIPWEEATEAPLAEVLRERVAALGGPAAISEVRLFIGPEGGFSAREVALARRGGALAVTLGPRILRAETAALVAATLSLGALGALAGAPVREA